MVIRSDELRLSIKQIINELENVKKWEILLVMY
jgi:hypothetical protein